VDVSAGRVLATYPATAATVSPDGRAVIVEDAARRVGLVPLTAPDDPSIGKLSAFYIHPQAGPVRQSDFHWTDPEVVAFIEFAGADARIVALQVDGGGKIQKRGEKLVPLKDHVKDGLPSPSVLTGVEITRAPSAGLILRVQFPASPSMGPRTVDVRMWD
jgi:hypothetical protein